jgi:hypothetical protein
MPRSINKTSAPRAKSGDPAGRSSKGSSVSTNSRSSRAGVLGGGGEVTQRTPEQEPARNSTRPSPRRTQQEEATSETGGGHFHGESQDRENDNAFRKGSTAAPQIKNRYTGPRDSNDRSPK